MKNYKGLMVGVLFFLGIVVGVIVFSIRKFLSFRYKVDVKGLDNIKEKKGYLIMPNHPASIDPVILMTYLWKKIRIRPVISETYYKLPIINPAMKMIGAIPMPDLLKDSGEMKKRRVIKALEQIGQALENGDNVLLYPAGKLKTGAREVIGGAFGAKTVLDNAPNAKVLLVRTTGLYGSGFSTAANFGVSPDVGARAKLSFKVLFKNLFVLTPKRKVEIQIEEAPKEFPRNSDLTELNSWLEDYYNQDGDELKLVRYFFWSDKLPEIEEPEESVDISKVSEEIKKKVLAELSEMSKIPEEEIKPEQRLTEDLGLDSLHQMGIVELLEQEFGIFDVEGSDIRTVGLLMLVANGHKPKLNERNSVSSSPKGWDDSDKRGPAKIPYGHTLIEMFFSTATRMGNANAIADNGFPRILTWKKLKIAVIAMAEEIRELPGEKIAIMMPASVGATIAMLAVMTVGKIPVMLNWTMGTKNLKHALEVSGAEKILTSEMFLDRINVDVSFLEEKFIFLEDLKAKMNKWKLFKALMQSWKGADGILSKFGSSKVESGQTAVILFTSGSESAPKGVPLTHRNIISNIVSVFKAIPVTKEDVVYGFLPPFHSFGLTVTTFLPLVLGVRTVFHPNPTESRKLVNGCARWGISIMCGTPTFLSSILNSGTKEQFKSLRVMVSGAEKAPEALFEKVAEINPELSLLEGYGITECSPVVTATRSNEDRIGVGRPLSGIEIKIVHPESHEPLQSGERGLILISGENVFKGYLGSDSDPFVMVDGRKWYNSGDLGIMQYGFLTLAGRLKRFIKIGGEMISLPAIEEALAQAIEQSEDGPTLAIAAKESENGERPSITLFSVADISEKEANTILRESGFPPLVSVRKAVRLDTIPILGTGKTDYQKLNTLIPE